MRLRFGSRAAGALVVAGAIMAGSGAFAVGALAGAARAGRAGGAAARATGAAAARAHAADKTVTPARDSFSGRLRAGSGRYAHAHGSTSVYLRFRSSTGQTRIMTATIRGIRCRSVRQCLDLRGTLTGTVAAATQRGPTDVGHGFTLRATGRIVPLGEVAASGHVHGTGFIRWGRETMQLILRAHRGKLTIDAQSRLVPGFTSP
jgi:hypothetical protein